MMSDSEFAAAVWNRYEKKKKENLHKQKMVKLCACVAASVLLIAGVLSVNQIEGSGGAAFGAVIADAGIGSYILAAIIGVVIGSVVTYLFLNRGDASKDDD